MIIAKTIGVFFAILMIYTTFLHFKRREFSKLAFIFWMVLWLGFSVMVAFAEEAGELAKILSFQRLMDFITVVGLGVLCFLTFKNYAALSKLKKEIGDFVRDKALNELDGKSK